ncbi:MAG: hypothetical protein JWM32_41 [Verrucomicrobia bacterium]|nr:hypothetical protein [Verrucomicrobiota bacterium]
MNLSRWLGLDVSAAAGFPSRGVLLVLAGLSTAPFGMRAADPKSPNELGEVGLWLVAADLGKDLSEGQPVSRWADRSPHGYDAVFEACVPQAALAVGRHHPPQFKVDGGSGFPAVSFNALDRETLLLGMAGHALGQKVHGFTAVFVLRPLLTYPPPPSPDMPWTKRRYLFISHLSDFSTRFSVQVIEDTGEVKLLTRLKPGEALERFSSTDGPEPKVLKNDAWQRVIVTVDCLKKEAHLVIDGVDRRYALPATSGDTFEDLPSPITGIASTTLGDWLTCQLAEIICYERALTPEETAALDVHLAGKYHLMPAKK